MPLPTFCKIFPSFLFSSFAFFIKDHQTLRLVCKAQTKNPLRRLRAITHSFRSFHDVDQLPIIASSPLQEFMLSTEITISPSTPIWTTALWDRINENHAQTPRRFVVGMFFTTDETFLNICEKCEHLEDLFIY